MFGDIREVHATMHAILLGHNNTIIHNTTSPISESMYSHKTYIIIYIELSVSDYSLFTGVACHCLHNHLLHITCMYIKINSMHKIYNNDIIKNIDML